MPDAAKQRSLVIILPVYNDWEPLKPLLDQMDAVLAGLDIRGTVLLVDDSSPQRPEPNQFRRRFVALSEIHLLSLRRNLGHQRAIAIGLSFAHDHFNAADMILIMDSDGQDAPSDFHKLLAKFDATSGGSIVFAERKRRSEGVSFRFFYMLFRVVHQWLTTHSARVGNFSLLPREQLRRLVVVSEIWNNYAAAVRKARLPYALVPIDRAKRTVGETKMNFSSLVSHGLSAMSIYNDVIGVRTLSLAIVLTLAAFVLTGTAAYFRLAVWRTGIYDVWVIGSMILLAMMVLVCGVLATFLLNTLADRNTTTFLPMRDYRYYFDTAERVDL